MKHDRPMETSPDRREIGVSGIVLGAGAALLLHIMLIALLLFYTEPRAADTRYLLDIERLAPPDRQTPRAAAPAGDRHTHRRPPPAHTATAAHTRTASAPRADVAPRSVPRGESHTDAAGQAESAAARPVPVAGGERVAAEEALTSARVEYLSAHPPRYPPRSRLEREEGRVLLRVEVRADGQPEAVNIEQSSGYPRLDQAACDAVAHWRFRPARRAGLAIPDTVRVPVRFSLHDR